MKRIQWLMSLTGVAVLSLAGSVACGDESAANPTETGTTPQSTAKGATTQPTAKQPTPGSTRSLQAVLTDAINDEYRARATYAAVLEKFGQVTPFINIRNAENSHVESLKKVFDSNKIAVPEDTFAGKVTAPATVKDACAAGVAAEKANIALYDKLMKETTNAEALNVMTSLRSASNDNHLPAFEACAK